MELLEIKFEASSSADLLTPPVFGGTIWCDLKMGSISLTNGSIPIWCFGRAENLAAENMVDSTDNLTFFSYSWRLPRPLFIPAGATVIPTFVHTGYINSTINMRVGYSARTIFKKPKKICVPWVAKYASKVFTVSDVGVDRSSELDLVNPHPEPLNLQRFVGRLLSLSEGSSSDGEQSLISEFVTMRMTDSYGRPIVRSFSPSAAVFEPSTRSWEMDNGSQLDPESFYIVDLNLSDNAVNIAAGDVTQVFISCVGWREMVSL